MAEAHYSPGETHVDLVAVKKVNVGFVLVFVLTHQQQHGGVAHLIQDCLAQLDDGQGKVLQLLLQEQQGEAVSCKAPRAQAQVGQNVSETEVDTSPTCVSQSSSRTALSVTCRSTSWVQILSFESRRASFLMASSTVTVDSALSITKVERC